MGTFGHCGGYGFNEDQRSACASEAALEQQDICGLCGKPGADKYPHPVRWPGEQAPNTDLVHEECEREECARAHANLTDSQRDKFLSAF